MPSYYEILRVSPTATDEAIREAYAQMRAAYQGQTGTGPDQQALRLLDAAYATLSDPASRKDYDRTLDSGATIRLPQPLARPAAPQPLVPARPTALAPAPSVLGAAEATPRTCPHCGQQSPAQANFCAHCRRQIANPCPGCGQLVTLGQPICLRCETVVPEYHKERFEQGEQTARQIAYSRAETDARARTGEVVYAAQVRATVIFWSIAAALALAIVLMVWLVLPLLGGAP